MSVWLSVKEAAVRSGFSTKTLYRAIAASELQAEKVRSRWRIRVPDLEAWLHPSATVVARAVVQGEVWPEAGSREALRLIERGRR